MALATKKMTKTIAKQNKMLNDVLIEREVLSKIGSGEMAPTLPSSSPMHAVVDACCQHVASKRPCAAALVEFIEAPVGMEGSGGHVSASSP